MAYITGIVLGVLTGLLARLAGFDRDRALYPAVLIVIPFYYVLFAVMGGSERALLAESFLAIVFTTLAVVGFRSSLWLVVAALAAHGVWDSVHDRLVSNPGVPAFWPSFCLSIDLTLAAVLAWVLRRGIARARRPEPTSAIP